MSVMRFRSTRDAQQTAGFGEALAQGLAPDGGLYVPTEWPHAQAGSFGVREGLLHEKLSEAERGKDGLICAAEELNQLLSRSARHARELIAWSDRLVRVVKLRETAEDRRLPVFRAAGGGKAR